MKKYILIVLIAVLFVFGAAADENWRDLSSSSDIVGKWDGYKVLEIPKNEEMYLPKTSIEISVTFEYIMGSEEVIGNMKIDMNRFMTDWAVIPEIMFLGFTKDLLWDLMQEELGGLDGFTIGGRYFFNYDLSGSLEDFLKADAYGKVQINENGNKIRILFFDDVSFGLGDDGFDEIVLDKR